MSPVLKAAKEMHAFLRKLRWKYCMIGGLAVARWGEERSTKDVDFVVMTGIGDERRYLDRILATVAARFPDARAFALMNRVLLAQASNGVGVDISLGALPYEERMVERASMHTFVPRTKWMTVSAEDLVVQKAFAGRDHDWVDVKGILQRQMPRLDWKLIVAELEGLLDLKEEWSGMDRLMGMRKQVERELKKERK